MSGFFSVGSMTPISRSSSRKGRRKVANAEESQVPGEESLDTPEAMKRMIVKLHAKLWDAERKIGRLQAEKSKQGTKFGAIKRAAQMETVLHKVRSEVDTRVDDAVSQRLADAVHERTVAERERAEQAEEEAKQLRGVLENKEREIGYLQTAKRSWQKRAKEAEALAQRISTAGVNSGGDGGLLGNAPQLANLLRGSKPPTPEANPGAGSRQYSSLDAIAVGRSLESKRSLASENSWMSPEEASPPGGVFQGVASFKSKTELLLEDVQDKLSEPEPIADRVGGLDDKAGSRENVTAVEPIDNVESWIVGVAEEDEEEETGDGLPNERAQTEPMSFQEAYDLTAQRSLTSEGMMNMFNNLIQQTTNADNDWRRNRDAIDGNISKWSDRAAFCGCVGAACAVIQNEVIFDNSSPSGTGIDVAKLINTIFTLLTAVCVYRVSKLRVLFYRVSMHMTRGWPLDLDVHFFNVVRETSFAWEMALVLPHLPPGVTFEMGVSNMGNFVLYRGETVGCLYNSLRTYLLWRVIKHRMLDAFPKRHTVATYTQTELQSSFAVKVMFDGWFAAFYVGIMWAFLMLVLGYWFRSAEITACTLPSATDPQCNSTEAQWWTSDGVNFFEKTNDFYMANAVWAMFVTATSVGYGDIFPLTHLGRFIASIAALVGIILIALLTAALAHGLTFTPEQHTALSLLEREKARTKLLKQAASLIAFWWRLRSGTIPKSAKSAQKMYLLRTEFRQVKMAGQADMDNFMADTAKVNQLSTLMLQTRERVEEVEDLISGNQMVELPDEPQPPEQESGPPSPKARSPLGLYDPANRKLERTESESRRRRYGPGRLFRQPRMGKRNFDSHAWKRSREKVEVQRMKASRRAAFVGTLGIIFPIIQNELIYQKTDPGASTVELAKALNTGCTLLLLYYVFKLYRMKVLFARVSRHLDYGRPLDTEKELSEVLQQRLLWVELFLCAVHLPPFVTFELGSSQLDNFVMYRAESVLCLVNTLRLYLLGRVLRDAELVDLPRKHTVQRFTGVSIGYGFALKRVFNSLLAVWYIALLWAGSIFVAGYWFRIGEFSACRLDTFKDARCNATNAVEWTLYGSAIEANNMLYLQNAIWTMWVTGTTVGYGDIFPITHVGRLFAALSSGLGLIIAALFTASLSNSLVKSPQEEAAMNLLRRNKAKQDVLVKAVTMVQVWWRRKKRRPRPLWHRRTDPHQALQDFTRTKIAANAELNSMKNISGQLTDLHQEGKILYQFVDDMHARTRKALLAIVQAARHAQEAQDFLQARADPPTRPGTSQFQVENGGHPGRTGSHPSVGEISEQPVTVAGGGPAHHVQVGGGHGEESSGEEESTRNRQAGGRRRRRRKSTVEFFGDGRRASVTTYY